MNKIKTGLLMIVLLLTGASCNKQLQLDPSRQADEAGHWNSYEDARSGLIGMYGLFRAAVSDNNAHWVLGELRNGDFRSVVRSDLKAVIEGNLNASFPVIQSVTNWRRFYAVINACNLFIERVSGCLADKRYTETYLKLDIAQARSVRAFAYFYMVRIWGDVPLITRSQEGSFEALPRTSQDNVLSFAERELIEASARLPFLYSGNDPTQTFPNNYYGFSSATWLNTLITKLAAYALLAHIAAWQGRYIDVAVYTEYIVNNFGKSNLTMLTTPQLVGDNGSPGGVFNTTAENYNQLIGFNFIRERGETTTEGHIEQLTLANTTLFPMSKQLPDIYIRKDSISAIFPRSNGNDQRFGVDETSSSQLPSTAYFENYNSQIPVFKKIRVVDGAINNTGQYAVFNSAIVFTRLEEIRLLRAEALAVLGQTGPAISELNSVRAIRGINPVLERPSLDLITEVFQERRRELMGEGWRWYDLIRYNRLKRNDTVFNELINNGGIYWPIAEEVLSRNKKLVQNSYWR